MIRARSLLSLALVLSSLATLTASCGGDKPTDTPNDEGPEGGADSKAGGGGRGGEVMAGNSGRGSAGGSSSSTNVGKACTEVTNCGPELQCEVLLDIPGGICTAECADTSECEGLSPGAVCLGGLCLEGCSAGGLGAKCHGRLDMACTVSGVLKGTACMSDGECGADEACLDGSCLTPLTACLPSCASDAECGVNVCDLSTGSCNTQRKENGLPIGSACTPGLSDEEDPCEGFCVRTGDGPTDAFCSGYCRWTTGVAGCGFGEDATEVDAACLYPSSLLPNAADGDTGFCGQLCDCDADCLNAEFKCLEFLDNGSPATYFGRRGGCSRYEDGDPNIPVCESGGVGGESGGGDGGAAAGGATAGGDSGSGGSTG